MSARQDVKAELTSLLETALVGVGLPVQAVYGYKTPDFDGQSPVVVVDVVGSAHSAPSTYGGWPAVVNVNLYVFALYTETGTSYTNEDAEEQLADIEERISTVVRANQTADSWSEASYRGDTIVGTMTLGGNTYRFEEIPLALQVA